MKDSRLKSFLYFTFFILIILLVGGVFSRKWQAPNIFAKGFNSVQRFLGFNLPSNREEGYSPDYITQEVVQEEGGKKQIDIAQGKELLRRINEKLNGEVYRLIRTLDW